MEKLIERTRQETTEQILDCLMQIGGDFLESQELRMVRAALIQVYEERTSPEEADLLMDAMGL